MPRPSSLRPASRGHPTRSYSKVTLEPIDAAAVRSQIDAASGSIRPSVLTRTRSLPHAAIHAIERMRSFTKESAVAEEQQGRRVSKKASEDTPHRRASTEICGEYQRCPQQRHGGSRRGSMEAGQLRRTGMLRSGNFGSQQNNLAPSALGKGREDDRLVSHRSSSSEHSLTAAQAAAEVAAVAEVAGEAQEKRELERFSRELGMPVGIVKDAAELFKLHVDGCGTNSLFEATVPMITLGDLFEQKIEEHDETKRADFKSFAMAFFCRGFSEACVLTPVQRQMRQLGRKHRMDDMDFYKRCFDEFDSNQNGTIDAGEFRALLYRLNKMPDGYRLPESRVSQLWAEADTDKNGAIDFEEFVHFYRRYYERKNGEKCPFIRFDCTARKTSSASASCDKESPP